MTEPTILFVKPGAISAEDTATLRQAGVIVVGIESLKDAKFVRAGVELNAGSMLTAAAHAINQSDLAQKEFGRAVCAAIDAQYCKDKA